MKESEFHKYAEPEYPKGLEQCWEKVYNSIREYNKICADHKFDERICVLISYGGYLDLIAVDKYNKEEMSWFGEFTPTKDK